MSGGGKAWLKDQEEIYNHAKGLGIIDVPHPWGDDRKQGTEDDLTKSQWSNFTDRLNAAKSGGWSPNAEQSERSSDWYRTPEGAAYAASIGKPVGFGINAAFPVEGGGGGSGSPTNPGTGIGPYPLDNMYFPQLTHAYEAPQAQDWSQYLPSWINGPLSQMGGLLYQPGTQEYMEQFPMPENIWNYQPPQINRQPVQYAGPPSGGLMEVASHGPSSGNSGDYDPYSDDRGSDGTSIRSGWITGADGKGYATDKHGMVIGPSGYPSVDLTAKHNPQQKVSTTISNAIAKALGITLPTATEMEVTEADLLGGISKSGVDPDPTAGDDTFGLGISP